VGAAFGEIPGPRGPRGAGRLRTFVTRNPPLLAVVAGLVAPAWMAPNPLPAISHVVVAGLLVLGFFIVGINLSSERREDGGPLLERPDAPVALALGLRLVVAPLVVAGLSAATVKVPAAYILQAAMPTGINSLIVGHAYRLNQRMIATIIVWSTAVALVGGLVASAL
jgi:predicted permease